MAAAQASIPQVQLREAFRRRAMAAIERVARESTEDALVEALSAPTDLGTLARIVADAAADPSIAMLDPLALSLAGAATERTRLAAASGGLLTASDVATLLGISRQAVDKRRSRGQLLAMRVASDWRYPAVQFGDLGEPPDGLAECIAAMLPAGAWPTLDFLLTPAETLDGLSPLQALRAGGTVATALRRMLAAREADAFA